MLPPHLVNNIGDTGLASLSEALSSGALPQLKDLFLGYNQISDARLISLSGPLAN